MLQFIADENLNRHLLRGLLRRLPELDIVRVQDLGLAGIKDPDLLSWCAQENRLLVTHDVNTITKYARERVAKGVPMPGVVVIAQTAPLGTAIVDFVLLAQASEHGEYEGQILHLPL